MIRLILIGTLLLLSLAFFLQNQEQEVTLRYFFGLLEASTPIYKPILTAFAVGVGLDASHPAAARAAQHAASWRSECS